MTTPRRHAPLAAVEEKQQEERLQPRTLLGLIDASFELCATEPSLLWICWLGMAPVALASLLLWYGAREAVFTQQQEMLVAASCALLALFRYLPAGAATQLVLDGLEHHHVSPQQALAAALRRAPSLMTAGALSFWVSVVSLPLGFLSMVSWSGTYLGLPLTLQRACAPWGAIGAGRRLLGRNALRPALLTLLWVIGVLLLSANLWLLVAIGMQLASSLFDLDVALLGRLLSPANPIFLPSLGVLALIALEPVRQCSLALCYLDARIRRDALDLSAALDDVLAAERPVPGKRARSLKRRAQLGVLLLPVLLSVASPPVAMAAAPAPSGTPMQAFVVTANKILDQLQTLQAETPVDDRLKIDGTRASEILKKLPQESWPALTPLTNRLQTKLGNGETLAAAKTLQTALREMRWLGDLAGSSTQDDAHAERPSLPGDSKATPARADPEAAAALLAEVLTRPEFQRESRLKLDHSADNSWFDRLMERLQAFLETLFRQQESKASKSIDSGPLLPGFISWILWVVLLTVVIAGVLLAILRALGDKRDPISKEEPNPLAAHEEEAPPDPRYNALARSPDAWLSEADRLAAGGELREALRTAYLAVLAMLHRAQCIDYHSELTNWEHVRTYQGPPEARRRFIALTQSFDRSWYGFEPLEAGAYPALRSEALELFQLSTKDPGPGESAPVLPGEPE